MVKIAVVRTGGKQYLVQENQEISVDRLPEEVKKTVELETLALIDTEKNEVQLGAPVLKTTTKVEIVENLQADKVRVAKFKAKTRYRKVRGYRHQLSKIKVVKI
jgi:large subunit ribosomal protein L21